MTLTIHNHKINVPIFAQVKITYDYTGDDQITVLGEFEGAESRDNGYVYLWVREFDGTRYAIPQGMVEHIEVL